MWLHYFLIIYTIITGILFGNLKSGRNKFIYITLTFGFFIVLSALRSSGVGNDTTEYIRLFENISSAGNISGYSLRYEAGYLYLNKLLSLLSSNSQIIIIVTSIIIMGGFARFIYKYSNNLFLSVYLFFTLGYFGMSMNTIRLNIAIVVVLFSYDFLREKKLIKFIITVFLASLFHRTAIIFLLAWPITKLKFSRKTIGVSVVCSVSLYMFFPIILQLALKFFPIYQYYVGSTYLDGNTRLASVMNFLVGLSILVFGIYTNYHNKERIELSNKLKNTYSNDAGNMLLLLLTGVSITLVSFNFNLLDRVGDYFFVFSIVYLPNAINSIRDKNKKLIFGFIVVVLFFVYSTMIQIMRPDWNVIYPYEFFFNN